MHYRRQILLFSPPPIPRPPAQGGVNLWQTFFDALRVVSTMRCMPFFPYYLCCRRFPTASLLAPFLRSVAFPSTPVIVESTEGIWAQPGLSHFC